MNKSNWWKVNSSIFVLFFAIMIPSAQAGEWGPEYPYGSGGYGGYSDYGYGGYGDYYGGGYSDVYTGPTVTVTGSWTAFDQWVYSTWAADNQYTPPVIDTTPYWYLPPVGYEPTGGDVDIGVSSRDEITTEAIKNRYPYAQEKKGSCVAASIRNALKLNGIKVSEKEIRDKIDAKLGTTKNWDNEGVKGDELEKALSVLNDYGFEAHKFNVNNKSDLKLLAGKPDVVLAASVQTSTTSLYANHMSVFSGRGYEVGFTQVDSGKIEDGAARKLELSIDATTRVMTGYQDPQDPERYQNHNIFVVLPLE